MHRFRCSYSTRWRFRVKRVGVGVVGGEISLCNRLYVFIARIADHIDTRHPYETRTVIESQKYARRNWKSGRVHLRYHDGMP